MGAEARRADSQCREHGSVGRSGPTLQNNSYFPGVICTFNDPTMHEAAQHWCTDAGGGTVSVLHEGRSRSEQGVHEVLHHICILLELPRDKHTLCGVANIHIYIGICGASLQGRCRRLRMPSLSYACIKSQRKRMHLHEACGERRARGVNFQLIFSETSAEATVRRSSRR